MLFSTFLSVALFVAPALVAAQTPQYFEVDTPEAAQCQDVTLTWQDIGAQSYQVVVVPADATSECVEDLQDAGEFQGTSATFKLAVPRDTQIQFLVIASNDAESEAWSGVTTVRTTGDTSCLPAGGNSSSGSGSGSSGSSGTGSGSSAPTSGGSSGSGSSSSGSSSGSSGSGSGPDSGSDSDPSPSPSLAPVGAANAGIGGSSNSVNAAPSSRPLSVAAVALSAVAGFAAFIL